MAARMHIKFWLRVAGVIMFGVTAAAEVPAAEPAVDEAPPPPPPMPPLPISHHDRPLPLGVTYLGVLGDRCHNQKLPDGRRYSENSHGLMPGQKITLKLSSPDFSPTLTIFRKGEADSPLVTVTAASDGKGVARLFTAPDEAEYVLRVAGTTSGDAGRWQVELLYGDKIDMILRDEAAWQESADHSGCAAS